MPLAPLEQLEPPPAAAVVEVEELISAEIQPTITIPEIIQPEALPTTDVEEALRLTYEIEWRVDPTDPGYALAAVRLAATGGDGFYTFFRDETVTHSAYFSYRWSSCKDNSGTFRVESADGQSTSIEYFEQPPCPDRGQSEANNP